jgi:hypothetical protein
VGLWLRVWLSSRALAYHVQGSGFNTSTEGRREEGGRGENRLGEIHL